MSASCKWHRDVLRITQDEGLQNAHVEMGGRHPRVVGATRGKAVTMIFSHSPSDQIRVARQIRATIRRLIRQAEEAPHV